MPETQNRFSPVQILIFDLDGTLIDSKFDLANSVNATLVHMGHKPLSHETIFGYVGNGAPVLIKRALGREATEQETEAGLAFFLTHYREHKLDNTVLYPGVRDGLEMLKNYRMAILTNKPVNISRAILEGLGVASHFQFVYGGNSFEKKKPDPMGVEVLLRDFSATPPQAMMVGDSDVDVLTARNSGIWSCGVSYGLGTKGMAAHPPDVMLDSLTELPAHLRA